MGRKFDFKRPVPTKELQLRLKTCNSTVERRIIQVLLGIKAGTKSEKLAKKLNISKDSVYRIKHSWEKEGKASIIDRRQNNGAKPIISEKKYAQLKNTLNQQKPLERWGSSEVMVWLQQQVGYPVSRATAVRYIKKAGFRIVRSRTISSDISKEEEPPPPRRNRPRRKKKEQNYPSDLTDKQWVKIKPFLHGNPQKYALRDIYNAIFYVLRTGIPWAFLPKDYPPLYVVHHYFYLWRNAGIFEQLNLHLSKEERIRAGREESPSAGIVDSQSVKTGEKGG